MNFKIDDIVVKKNGKIFKSGTYTEVVKSIEGSRIWLSCGTFMRDHEIQLVPSERKEFVDKHVI